MVDRRNTIKICLFIASWILIQIMVLSEWHWHLGRFKNEGPMARDSYFPKTPQVTARFWKNWSWSAFQQKTIICEAWFDWIIINSFDPSSYLNPVSETKIYNISFCTDDEINGKETYYLKLPLMLLPANLEVLFQKRYLSGRHSFQYCIFISHSEYSIALKMI